MLNFVVFYFLKILCIDYLEDFDFNLKVIYVYLLNFVFFLFFLVFENC